MIWLLFGAPGSGKGTQSKLIQNKFGYRHLSTGDVLRKHLKDETELGSQAKDFMDNGELVPDEIVIEMVNEELKSATTTVLDGFPRTLDQGKALTALIEKNGGELYGVIYLDVPKELLVSRLSGRRVCKKCGSVYHIKTKPPQKEGICDECGGQLHQRKDDGLGVIKNRLAVYEEQTSPLIRYYKGLGKLNIIEGSQSPEDVFRSIEKVLNDPSLSQEA